MLRSTRFWIQKHESLQRLFVTTSVQCKTVQNTEQQEASSVENHSFVTNIFRGNIETQDVFPFPDALDKDQKEMIQMLESPFAKFFEEVNDPAKSDAEANYDKDLLKQLWNLGAFSMQVPPEYGGLGLTNSQYGKLAEIVGANDLAVAITLGAHQSIGFKAILLFGSPEIKEKYLKRVVAGEYAAFCLTEPSSGSDANSIKSRAVLSPDGKHYILNGSKVWISNGGIAEIMTVFAQTPVTDKVTGKTVDKITAFIVERSFGGVTNGPPEKKLGIKASNTTPMYFDNVKIPIENVINGEGNGFKVAMNVLNNGRFGMAAGLSGTMNACIKKAVEFAKHRVQFGHKISDYGTIQEKIARMSMLQYITESMAYMISGSMDNGSQHYHLEAAISKVFSSEAAWYVCDEAIQIMGGMGYMVETGLEKVLRDLRVFRVFEGANEILKLFVALTGIQYAGAHLKELQNAFKNPTANLGLILGEASKRVGKKVGLSSPPSIDHLVHPDLAPSAKAISKSIGAFSEAVESSLIKYGKGIVNEQYILNRLAYSAIDIYATVVALSRASTALKNKTPSSQHEKLMAEVWTLEATDRIENHLAAISSGKSLDSYTKMSAIAKMVCEKDGVVQGHPLAV